MPSIQPVIQHIYICDITLSRDGGKRQRCLRLVPASPLLPLLPFITPVTEDSDTNDMTLFSDGGKRQRRLRLLPTDRGVHLAACHALQRAGAARWRRLALSPSSFAPCGTSLFSCWCLCVT